MDPPDYLNMPMTEIVRRWPATIGVLLDLRMHCLGCPIALFHTPVEAAAAHGLPPEAVFSELAGAIAGTRVRAGPARAHRRLAADGADRAQAVCAVLPRSDPPAPTR